MSQDQSWRLDDLYASPDDPAIEADLARLDMAAGSFRERFRLRVAALRPAELRAAIAELEALREALAKVRTYASLLFAADALDPRHQALVARVRELGTKIATELLFFELDVRHLPAEQAALLSEAPELNAYRHYIDVVRAFAPHTLSEPEERILTQVQQTGASAWSQLYAEVTSAMRFHVEIDGATRELTDAETRALRSSPDRPLRRRAHEGLYSAYEQQAHVLTFTFNTLVHDHRLMLGMRRYGDPLEPTALENEFSPELIERLLSLTEQHYGQVAAYYRAKSERLGLSGDFQSYDVFAPHDLDERRFSYPQTQALVRESYASFHPTLGALVEQFYDGAWIDPLPRHGKRGGAFCSGGTPSTHPYVLMNFTGRLEDVFTLAHELGHGVHYALARQQTLFNFEPTIPMAEVASTFGELVLAEHLRRQDLSAAMHGRLLASLIEETIGTVFRQAMYTRFEQRAHARRAAGLVTAEEYGALWMEGLRHLYGEEVCFGPLDRWGWITIPHFVHYRFYCFSYVFGHLLALALLQRARGEGFAFAERYCALLAAGRSARPEALLAQVGVDPWAAGFWEQAFAIVGEWIADFQRSTALDTKAARARS